MQYSAAACLFSGAKHVRDLLSELSANFAAGGGAPHSVRRLRPPPGPTRLRSAPVGPHKILCIQESLAGTVKLY